MEELRASALSELLDYLAERLAEVLAPRLAREAQSADGEQRSPWMGIERAAAHLDWPKQRLYKLSASGEIPHYKHEARLLFHREELDRWLASFAQGERRSLSRSRSI